MTGTELLPWIIPLVVLIPLTVSNGSAMDKFILNIRRTFYYP